MNELSRFNQVRRAMSDPAFYPHPVTRLEIRETHISAVFLTGAFAYKLKKPLNFGFLDYTNLEIRREKCELEVRLNQRLSRGVYEGVVAISREGGRFFFGDSGEIVEYAVKMKQLDDDAALSSLLVMGKVNHEQMAGLGVFLANFYSRGERSEQVDRYGNVQAISINTEENFRQLKTFVGKFLSGEEFDFIMESNRGFLKNHKGLFDNRIAEGRICDGHGDLRAEHVYFLDGIQVIDCIEFNERFRYGDTAADLAFLHMDIERLQSSGASLSLPVLDGYMETTRDHGIFTVLDFYSCYRALVKMKVACLTWTELDEGPRKREMEIRAGTYLDLAFRYAIQLSRPALWVLCGMPGSGKSTVARKLKEILRIALFQSDTVRMDLPEYRFHSGPEPYGKGVYRPDLRGRVYARLLSLAHDELKGGRSVILDATFSRKKWREEAFRLAGDTDANMFFIECAASMKAVLERLNRRRAGEESRSEAGLNQLSGLLDEYERMDEISTGQYLRVDTETDVESVIRKILLEGYERKRKQVEEVIARF